MDYGIYLDDLVGDKRDGFTAERERENISPSKQISLELLLYLKSLSVISGIYFISICKS